MSSYNVNAQFRCTIIRGRGQSELEDYLPLYANMVSQTCPCEYEDFKKSCRSILANAIHNTNDFEGLPKGKQKTIDNHITEIAGALLGLYYLSIENEQTVVYESPSCQYLQQSQDYPNFFKNLCLRFQFPNGAQKPQTYIPLIQKNIHIKPYCFVIKLLLYAQTRSSAEKLSKQEIGYYALNNLEVLQGQVSVEDVYDAIIQDRQNGTRHSRFSGSNEWQHILEQFNWLTLTNLIRSDNIYVWLNPEEQNSIELFANSVYDFGFDAYSFEINTIVGRKEYERVWRQYYADFDDRVIESNNLSVNNIVGEDFMKKSKTAIKSTTDLGDEGETLVFNLEVKRIREYKPRLVNKVLLMGKTRGLGYDVLSLEGNEMPDDPEMNRFIEVKATRRTTVPNFNLKWIDSINLTAKEWRAAKQHGRFFNIYRVYFTQTKTIVIRVNDPFRLATEGKIDVFPTIYQMDFDSKVIEHRYSSDNA